MYILLAVHYSAPKLRSCWSKKTLARLLNERYLSNSRNLFQSIQVNLKKVAWITRISFVYWSFQCLWNFAWPNFLSTVMHRQQNKHFCQKYYYNSFLTYLTCGSFCKCIIWSKSHENLYFSVPYTRRVVRQYGICWLKKKLSIVHGKLHISFVNETFFCQDRKLKFSASL